MISSALYASTIHILEAFIYLFYMYFQMEELCYHIFRFITDLC